MAVDRATERLSLRETEIAEAFASGASYREIASRLGIAPATVRTHLGTVYRKLGVSSKIALLRRLQSTSIEVGDEDDAASAPQPPPVPFAAGRSVADGFELPPRPVIAVLPFTNMSGDATQEYFADGITEDIITRLSYLRGISVISRTSTFVFKNSRSTVREISAELGARFILEGSVRTAGRRVRVVAQLIDGETSEHLWSERYERELILDPGDIVRNKSNRRLTPTPPVGKACQAGFVDSANSAPPNGIVLDNRPCAPIMPGTERGDRTCRRPKN